MTPKRNWNFLLVRKQWFYRSALYYVVDSLHAPLCYFLLKWWFYSSHLFVINFLFYGIHLNLRFEARKIYNSYFTHCFADFWPLDFFRVHYYIDNSLYVIWSNTDLEQEILWILFVLKVCILLQKSTSQVNDFVLKAEWFTIFFEIVLTTFYDFIIDGRKTERPCLLFDWQTSNKSV